LLLAKGLVFFDAFGVAIGDEIQLDVVFHERLEAREDQGKP
jgi:hypothetical protein